MIVQGKAWGQSQLIWHGANVELHRIDVNQNGYCSVHRHQSKHNLFYVLSGALEIKVWQKAYELVDVTILRPGQTTTVSPGLLHQFRGLFATEALELYFVELRGDDIERESCGGANAASASP